MGRGRAGAIVVAIAVAACGTSTASPDASQPAATGATASTPAGTAPGGSTSSAGTAGPVIEGPGELVLADGTEGLAALGSHRATFTESFEGTIGGAASAWSITLTLDVAAERGARAMSVATTGPVPPSWPAAGRSVLADGAVYRVDADGCTATLADAGSPGAFPEPGALVPALVGATATGADKIDGVAVDTYTFDGLVLGIPDAAAVSGRVSLAASDQHVVRYSSEATGGPDLLGEDREGRLTTVYELIAGAPPPIELPEDCPAGVMEFAIPNEATNVSIAPGHISFSYGGTVANAVGVIRGGSVLAHWTAGEAVVRDDQAHLVFTAPGLVIDATVLVGDDGTIVELIAARA